MSDINTQAGGSIKDHSSRQEAHFYQTPHEEGNPHIECSFQFSLIRKIVEDNARRANVALYGVVLVIILLITGIIIVTGIFMRQTEIMREIPQHITTSERRIQDSIRALK